MKNHESAGPPGEVETCLGKVCFRFAGTPGGEPVILLHGVFLDGTMWDDCLPALAGFRLIVVDMPGHGHSGNIGRPWAVEECATMLLELMDALNLGSCHVLGHSWGAMTALRAAVRCPDRFRSLCLCNMPFTASSAKSRLLFTLQKFAACMPRFYGGKAAQALYSSEFLRRHPELRQSMRDRLARRPAAEIRRVIDAVLIKPGDVRGLIQSLNVPVRFVVGEHDYVGIPPGPATVVPGGHISPQEAPAETTGVAVTLISTGKNRSAIEP